MIDDEEFMKSFEQINILEVVDLEKEENIKKLLELNKKLIENNLQCQKQIKENETLIEDEIEHLKKEKNDLNNIHIKKKEIETLQKSK